jgi:hypothetical protein
MRSSNVYLLIHLFYLIMYAAAKLPPPSCRRASAKLPPLSR